MRRYGLLGSFTIALAAVLMVLFFCMSKLAERICGKDRRSRVEAAFLDVTDSECR